MSFPKEKRMAPRLRARVEASSDAPQSPRPAGVLARVRTTLEMIKFEHSLFALPFALTGALLAARGWPTPWQILWIVVAMVSARSAAMTLNRIVDIRFDALNPRTRLRPLATGKLSMSFAAGFTIISGLVFILAVGVALGLSPVAAWIALRGDLSLGVLLLGGAVTLWVAGFDLIYACQDVDFDRQQGLASFPSRYGIAAALHGSTALHVLMLVLLIATARMERLGWLAGLGLVLVALLLAYEHHLVKPSDLSKVNAAFFTINGYISVLFFLTWAADILLRQRV